MKIAFDGKRAFHNFRGLGNYSRTLVEGLTEFYPDNDYSLYTPKIRDHRAYEWKSQSGLSFQTIEPHTYLGQKFGSLWRSVFLSSLLGKHKPHIYHGLSHELPLLIKGTGIKSVVTIHDLIFMRYPEFFSRIDRIVYRFKFKYACKKADVIIAICEQTKRDIIEFFGISEEKIQVAYQSCNTLFYDQKTSDELQDVLNKYNLSKEFVLYVGAVEERKNVLSLVKAFHESNLKEGVELVIIGNGKEYKDKVTLLVKELNIQNRVKFLSGIPSSELPAIYQLAKVFAFPSFFEGFGIPIIEALFSGTPVVTSKGSCFSESGGPGSLYADPENYLELKEMIEMVFDDENLRERMIKDGLDYVKRFHWKKTSERLMEIYSKLLRE